MAVFFTRRGLPEVKTVLVTITGSGSSKSSYVTISGTTYTEATSGIEIMEGDEILLAVGGRNATVTIDGTTVLTSTSSTVETYSYTVPAKVSSIAIQLGTQSASYGYIVVTTTRKTDG